MERQAINIKILGRVFPAVVDTEEAEVIQQAADGINEKIKMLKAEYTKQEDLDIAIMCCLDIMTNHLKEKVRIERQKAAILQALTAVDRSLDASIQAIED